MKNVKFLVPFLLLTGLTSAISIMAQTSITDSEGEFRSFSYTLMLETPVYECNILGDITDSTLLVAPQWSTFNKVGTKGENLIIRFWVWKKDTSFMKRFNYKDKTKKEYRYFLLAYDEFNSKAVARKDRSPVFTTGSSIIPLRIRTEPFSYSGEFSFGMTFGARIPLSAYRDIAVNTVLGLHLTHTSLDSTNTSGVVRVSETESALTPAIGAVFEFSGAQVGFYAGWDFISGRYKKDWDYQGKLWFSIGVGASLFTYQKSGTPAGGKEQQ